MKVLLIGDYCEDVFIEGEVTRLSPEVPVPVFEPLGEKRTPGMGGNVLKNLLSLSDGTMEVETWFPQEYQTKTRYVEQKTGHHFLRVDIGSMSGAIKYPGIHSHYDAVVISDYAKGFLSGECLERIGLSCEHNLCPLFVDTKSLLGAWSKSAIVKINEAECLHQMKSNMQPWTLCERLIVTHGGEGMFLFGKDGTTEYHVPAVPIEVKDGAGCGDSVLAALVVRYLENGSDLKDAMVWAGKVGASAVSKRGVVAVKREEIL